MAFTLCHVAFAFAALIFDSIFTAAVPASSCRQQSVSSSDKGVGLGSDFKKTEPHFFSIIMMNVILFYFYLVHVAATLVVMVWKSPWS